MVDAELRKGHRRPLRPTGRPDLNQRHVAAAAQYTPGQRWRRLAVILIATLMAQFDLFVVNVAAPGIQTDLHASTAAMQVIIGGYSLTYGTLLIAGGRLGDALGTAYMLRIGMLLFGVTSLLCAVCTNSTELALARLLQGACAAMMVPQVLSLVTVLFPPDQRRQAAAWFGVTLGLGAALGQSVGGLLVSTAVFGAGWRTIFLIVVPPAVLGAIAVGKMLPAARIGSARISDPLGLAGLSAALLMLFLFLTIAPDHHWPTWGWILVAAAVSVGAVTIRAERRLGKRGGHPIIDTELFAHRTFQVGLLVNAAYFFAFGGFLFAMTFTLQDGLHEAAIRSGLTFVPQGVGFACAALVGVALANRLGPWLVTIGALISASACGALLVLTSPAGPDLSPLRLAPVMAMLGVGNGLAIPAMIGAVLQIVPKQSAGTAAGMLTTVQQVAMAFGVAVFGSILFATTGRSAPTTTSLPGLRIDLVLATSLLALGALSSLALSTSRRPSPT